MHRIVVVLAAVVVLLSARDLFAQTRPAESPRTSAAPATPPAIAPGDEIKLDESGALKASAIQSKMSAILASYALLQRQAQDLQTEMTKALDDRKKLIDEAARKAKVEVREVNEWVYDEGGQRYIRSKKKP
jgi:hypothetical protein